MRNLDACGTRTGSVGPFLQRRAAVLFAPQVEQWATALRQVGHTAASASAGANRLIGSHRETCPPSWSPSGKDVDRHRSPIRRRHRSSVHDNHRQLRHRRPRSRRAQAPAQASPSPCRTLRLGPSRDNNRSLQIPFSVVAPMFRIHAGFGRFRRSSRIRNRVFHFLARF